MASFEGDAGKALLRMIRTPPNEPCAEPWTARRTRDVLAELLTEAEAHAGRPALIAVDGRQGGGKTTTAERLAQAHGNAIVVHSDDVAWWESFFGWDRLMAQGILEPLRRGEGANYRPPAWDSRGRAGSIVVPAEASLVLVEGVGTSRRSLAPLLDATVWIQSDWYEANRRGIERDGGGQAETDFWWAWNAEEQPFLADDRPWERAQLIICGTPRLTGVEYDPDTELLVGRSLRP